MVNGDFMIGGNPSGGTAGSTCNFTGTTVDLGGGTRTITVVGGATPIFLE